MCAKTFRIFTSPHYADHLVVVPPRTQLPEGERVPFDCSRSTRRDPRETNGADYRVTREASGDCCGSDGCC